MLDTHHPYTVPSNIQFVRLVVVGASDPLPDAVSAYTHQSPAKTGLRIVGGCANMSPEDRIGMLDFFAEGLRGFRGLVSSGGTREVTAGGSIDPMVTEVPAVLVAQSPSDIIAISSLPRTDDMGLVDESRLIFVQDGHVVPNPGVHMIIVVQSNIGDNLDWDGDLNTYFRLFGNLVKHGGWQMGMTVFNGGGVSRKEALRAASLGWPVILIEGSGRQADAIITEYRAGTLELPDYVPLDAAKFEVVNNGDAGALRAALTRHNLMPAT